MISGELKTKVDGMWDTMWSGGISNPLSVIEQLTYLLFIKRLDEVHTVRMHQAARNSARIESPIFGEKQQHLRWSHFKETAPEKMFETVRDEVFPFIKTLGATDQEGKSNARNGSAYSHHMKDAIFMIPTPRVLSNVVDQLDAIDMDDRDTKGDLYEYMLNKIAKAGQNGQFRTPRHIIRMMVDMTSPAPEDVICDPACGTAGYLVAAAEYLREHHKATIFRDEKSRRRFNTETFHGYDFDATMLRIGSMNMLLHGVENPDIRYRDSLAEPAKESPEGENSKDGEETAESQADTPEVVAASTSGESAVATRSDEPEGEGRVDESDADKYSLILANPPFAGSLDYESIAKDLQKIVKTKKTELLFIALFLRLLEPGGRAAVIVPDGVLFGSSKAHRAVRELLVEKHKLDAVVSMPSGVFKPYAGVSTAILLFTKTNTGGTDSVWFYDMHGDGLSLDDKRAPKPESNDIPDILARWKNLPGEAERTRTEQSFLVPREEIAANGYDLSINRYKEVVYEEVEYDPPTVILQRIAELEDEIAKGRAELEGMLG